MLERQHTYQVDITWTGNQGKGTSDYQAYGRNYRIEAMGKPEIPASADPIFRGDKSRYNPEELFLAAIASCHMLWFLHLCSENGIVVTSYTDTPLGLMADQGDRGGRFVEVTLHPSVTVTSASMIAATNELHQKAHQLCFIANSCNFPIHHQPACHSEKE